MCTHHDCATSVNPRLTLKEPIVCCPPVVLTFTISPFLYRASPTNTQVGSSSADTSNGNLGWEIKSFMLASSVLNCLVLLSFDFSYHWSQAGAVFDLFSSAISCSSWPRCILSRSTLSGFFSEDAFSINRSILSSAALLAFKDDLNDSSRLAFTLSGSFLSQTASSPICFEKLVRLFLAFLIVPFFLTASASARFFASSSASPAAISPLISLSLRASPLDT